MNERQKTILLTYSIVWVILASLLLTSCSANKEIAECSSYSNNAPFKAPQALGRGTFTHP